MAAWRAYRDGCGWGMVPWTARHASQVAIAGLDVRQSGRAVSRVKRRKLRFRRRGSRGRQAAGERMVVLESR